AIGLYASNKLHLPRGGNDSFSLVMAPGDKTLDEIVSSIEKGILVGRFSGGQPSSNGDFSGVAKNSFLIENGKIGPALSETMISGNLADMLFRLRDVSSELVEDGMSVLPYAAFDGITVSGK
ncbi:MAG: TldD/PmbA family protein, partial [Clostridia bacterium]|nr:TldD/PmbA family protein [Clostridia bacterium]